jgi:DNA polymerase-3 subunit delta'
MNHPLVTPELFGHPSTVLSQLQEAIANGQLAHGLLLSGPQGIGKATLAYMLARKLLGEGEDVFGRLMAGSHSDLMVIQPLFDEKKEEFAKEISVEQTRGIAQFFSMTAGEGGWRIVIIDGADSMNMQASNAILKILEEPPPNAILILVAHRAGKLLATIRSRCRTLKIMPPDEEDFMTIMRRHLPESDREEILKLGEITDHSPGLALQLHKLGALELYEQLELIFDELPGVPHERVFAIAEQVASGKQHQNFQIFTRLVLHLLAKRARRDASAEWAEKWQQASEQFALCETRHLDYKSVIISFFHTLPQQAHAA